MFHRLSPNILESNIPMVRSFHTALEEHARICGSQILTWEQLDRMNLEGNVKEATNTFQHALTKLQTPSLYNNLIAQVSDTKLLAWLTSLKSEDSKSSKWLQMTPKTPTFKFSDKQFQVSLCYRLFLQLPCYVPTSRCYCKKAPALDPRGHHIANGCQKWALFSTIMIQRNSP
jgi:hypothetical protein